MIEEYTLEDDSSHEFRGGSLRINATKTTKGLDNVSKSIDNSEIDKDKNSKINTNCQWSSSTFISPLTSLPSKISVALWNNKQTTTEVQNEPPEIGKKSATTKTIQSCVVIPEDPNNYFTFRQGVVENVVRECKDEFIEDEIDGPLVAYFLLTQINHWDTDKERLIMLTPKTMVTVKYDFIALKRLGHKKLNFDQIEQVYIGDLIYPNGSLIPRLNGIADGLNNMLENCLFNRWTNNENKQMNNFYQSRDRNMKGIRLMWKQEKPLSMGAKWNPFNDTVPFCTYTYHPLFFHKDCTPENRKNVYDLDIFIEKLCDLIVECQKKRDDMSCGIYYKNIILENYVGIGSLIHNRNALGYFKVRGKFSF